MLSSLMTPPVFGQLNQQQLHHHNQQHAKSSMQSPSPSSSQSASTPTLNKETLKRLFTETLVTLCQSPLITNTYPNFKIEALVGLTLKNSSINRDKDGHGHGDDVILINIQQDIKTNTGGSGGKRRFTPKKHVERERIERERERMDRTQLQNLQSVIDYSKLFKRDAGITNNNNAVRGTGNAGDETPGPSLTSNMGMTNMSNMSYEGQLGNVKIEQELPCDLTTPIKSNNTSGSIGLVTPKSLAKEKKSIDKVVLELSRNNNKECDHLDKDEVDECNNEAIATPFKNNSSSSSSTGGGEDNTESMGNSNSNSGNGNTSMEDNANSTANTSGNLSGNLSTPSMTPLTTPGPTPSKRRKAAPVKNCKSESKDMRGEMVVGAKDGMDRDGQFFYNSVPVFPGHDFNDNNIGGGGKSCARDLRDFCDRDIQDGNNSNTQSPSPHSQQQLQQNRYDADQLEDFSSPKDNMNFMAYAGMTSMGAAMGNLGNIGSLSGMKSIGNLGNLSIAGGVGGVATGQVFGNNEYSDSSPEDIDKYRKTSPGNKNKPALRQLRMYSCNQCNKTFNHSSHLKDHTRIHTGEKPFACHVCRKGFRQKQHLKKHLQVHKNTNSTGLNNNNIELDDSMDNSPHTMNANNNTPADSVGANTNSNSAVTVDA